MEHSLISQLRNGLIDESVTDTGPWRSWLPRVFPEYVTGDFAPFHADLWDWVWSLDRGTAPPPFVGIWFRGSGKSTSAEMAVVAAGRRRKRSFVLYVSGTQEQADVHVQNIAALLESPEIEADDPALSARKLTKYGHSRSWRRNRLMSESGLIVDALGLDVNVRGIKVDEHRPDLIIIDDVDNERDTPDKTAKKIERLTRAILPAGSDDVAVIAMQNMVLTDGVFAKLATPPGDGERAADFLIDRQLSGPIPAVYDLDYEMQAGRAVITDGTPAWSGMDLQACQREVETIGLLAFLVECQHEVRARGDVVFDAGWFPRYDIDDPAPRNLAVQHMQFWDTAEETGDGHAYTVCLTVDLMPDYSVNIRDVYRARIKIPQLPVEIERQARKHNRDEKLADIVIEYASSGKAAYQDIHYSTVMISHEWLRPHLKRFRPRGDKVLRAQGAAQWCVYGLVGLPQPSEGAPWLAPFERELFTFPQSEQMDQVDCLSMMAVYMRNYFAQALEARGMSTDVHTV